MEFAGRVRNGVVVLEGSIALPEGAIVAVVLKNEPAASPPVAGADWMSLRGIAPNLLDEDAQAWVSRTRKEADRRRAQSSTRET